MNDAGMMSRGKGARHVGARIEHVADAHCAAVQTVAQAFTFNWVTRHGALTVQIVDLYAVARIYVPL